MLTVPGASLFNFDKIKTIRNTSSGLLTNYLIPRPLLFVSLCLLFFGTPTPTPICLF